MRTKLIAAVLGTLLTAAGVGTWAYRHPTFHLPPTILNYNPALFGDPPPRHLTKVISASACALVNGFTWNGPGVTATYGAVLVPAGDFIINPNSPNQGPTTPETPPDTLILFCDARLPDDTVSFDYAELEYFSPNTYANHPPTLATYLDARAPNVNGFAYSQTMPLGSCTGTLSTPYSGTNPVSLCATDGGQSFYPDAGVPGVWPGAGWSLFSIHFQITIPPSPDPNLPNIAYRVIAHYQAP